MAAARKVVELPIGERELAETSVNRPFADGAVEPGGARPDPAALSG